MVAREIITNTEDELNGLANDFEGVISVGCATGIASNALIEKAKALVSIASETHTIVVPAGVPVTHVDGGQWIPAMVYVPCSD